VVAQVLGEVDRGHAARPDLPGYGVAVGQGRLEALELVGQSGLRGGLKYIVGRLLEPAPARLSLSVATLRNWEQGRRHPDGPEVSSRG
jgi:hypothetical protein